MKPRSTAVRTKPAPTRTPPAPTIYTPDKYPRLRADLRKIKVDANGCWNWVGGESKVPAAIYVYELLNDTLAAGSSLEPHCRNDFCVCPFHMKEVTSKAPSWYANLSDPFHRLPQAPAKPVPLPKALHQDDDLDLGPKRGKAVNYPTFGKKSAPTGPKPPARTLLVAKNATPAVQLPPLPMALARETVPLPWADKAKAYTLKPGVTVQTQDIVELCGNGHPKTPENVYLSKNGTKKECRVCKKLRDKKRKGHV